MAQSKSKSAIVMASALVVSVGDVDLHFNVGVDDYNKYINNTQPNDKVLPAFNFLSSTLVKEDREKFKEAVLVNDKPHGFIIMQIVGVLAVDFGADVEISLKKPS